LRQYQFCNPQNRTCTPTTSINDATHLARKTLFLTSIQLATLGLLEDALHDRQIDSLDTQSALAYTEARYKARVAGLPIQDLWIKSFQEMHDQELALLQRKVVDYAMGPENPEGQYYFTPASADSEKALCNMIRIRADGRYYNTNIYALYFTIFFGALVALGNFYIVEIASRIHKRRNRHSVSLHAWLASGLHQLQRQVFESRGQGPWEQNTAEIPRTAEGDCLARPDGDLGPMITHLGASTPTCGTKRSEQSSPAGSVSTNSIDRQENRRFSIDHFDFGIGRA